jgi:peptidoglycan/xylan/chitin deacetylase (PgdA/CDA1 family)
VGKAEPDRDSPPRWRPSPFLRASLTLHQAVAVVTAIQPRLWPWALTAVIADHALITAAGLWPRSSLLGENWVRLPAAAAQQGWVAITIDDGPDPEVTPQVLAILAAHEARANFFCIGQRAEAHPELVRSIVAAGHAVENHGHSHHTLCSLKGPRGWAREIGAAQEALTRISGAAPRFYRPTAGLRNPFLDPVLQRMGLHLANWTRRGFDTRNTSADDVFARLAGQLAGGDILLLHDGHAARTTAGQPVIVEVLPRLLDALASRQLQPVTLRSALP